MHHPITPFSIPAIRNTIPERYKPWIVVFFVICIQFSGGVYLAVVSEMVGSLSLMREDILMAGYASMVGMALTFAVMFRLKFRFTSKVSLLTCCSVIIICNLVCMHTQSVPILVLTCFVAGIFRMWATFECNSTIQLWLTPVRDMSVFFCYIYLLVQGCIQLSGVTAIYISFFTKWEYMHWLIIGLLCVVMCATLVLYNNKRFMRKLPLYGIDWLGAIMWAVTIMCILFICIYGEHYDWWDSQWIQAATIIAGITLLLNLWRTSFIRHPFIPLPLWGYPVVWITILLYIIFDLLVSPAHVLEPIYYEEILHYDALNIISLNGYILIGVLLGALFSYYYFALRKMSYRMMTLISFSAVTMYLILFYFSIDYNQSKESLILPLIFRSFAYVVIAVCFITALTRIPFHHFFQSLTIQSFISAGIGGVLGTAILERVLKVLVNKNVAHISTGADAIAVSGNTINTTNLFDGIYRQALMVTMKEIYGWLALLGLLCILLFMVKQSNLRPYYVIHPTYKAIRRMLGREMGR